jgi:integrase/recombinase XerC
MDTAGGLSGLVRSFELALRVEGLRPSTIRHYVKDVEGFAASVKGRSARRIKVEDIRQYVLDYQGDHAPKTVREMQLALRRFFRFLKDEGEIGRDLTEHIKLVSYRVEPQPTYSATEVKSLLMVCDGSTRQGVRDRALLLTLFDTGVRESELISMGLPDYEKRIARVSGKTGTRDVPLGLATLRAIDRYIRKWGLSEGPLWRGKRGELTPSGVLQIVRRRSRHVGIDHKGVHAFRRAAAAQMKRLGMNDSDILEVMGWRSIEMLRRYTAKLADELAHQAHRRFSPGDAVVRDRPVGSPQ